MSPSYPPAPGQFDPGAQPDGRCDGAERRIGGVGHPADRVAERGKGGIPVVAEQGGLNLTESVERSSA